MTNCLSMRENFAGKISLIVSAAFHLKTTNFLFIFFFLKTFHFHIQNIPAGGNLLYHRNNGNFFYPKWRAIANKITQRTITHDGKIRTEIISFFVVISTCEIFFFIFKSFREKRNKKKSRERSNFYESDLAVFLRLLQ